MYSICLLVAVTFVPSQPPQHTLRAQLEAAGVVPFTAYAELPAAVSHLGVFAAITLQCLDRFFQHTDDPQIRRSQAAAI